MLPAPRAVLSQAWDKGRPASIVASAVTRVDVYIREKGDVFLDVAKAPSFLAPGDPERSRLNIAMATCYNKRELTLLCSACGCSSWWTHAGTGGEAPTSAKGGAVKWDIVLNSRRESRLLKRQHKKETRVQDSMRSSPWLTLTLATWPMTGKARPATGSQVWRIPEPVVPS